ncbi:MAG TPA: hypothetical protein VFD87_12890 [Phototrophicaceae bacterium]|nr:hypothetical protein [Phototrophicaceae bacterium]
MQRCSKLNPVYLPGATSFTPAIRKLFEIFCAVAIRAGAEFTSVAEGLALFALELAPVVNAN